MTVDNVNAVINNVTSIVMSANDAADQTSDNLRVVANVLTQSVQVIQTQTASLEVVSQVSVQFNSSTQLIGFNCVALFSQKITTNAVEILSTVQDWPEEVVEMQSNMYDFV